MIMPFRCFVCAPSRFLLAMGLVFVGAFSFNVLTRDSLLAPYFDAWLGDWIPRMQVVASVLEVLSLLTCTIGIFGRHAQHGEAMESQVAGVVGPSYASRVQARLQETLVFRLLARVPYALILRVTAWAVISGAIIWLYAWMASGGTYRFRSASVPYADLLADAFLAGQLHLLVEPRPELLALADPYDSKQNGQWHLPDASLFNGKYYLYFGPVPGLIHAGWKLVTGQRIEEGAALLVAGVAGCLFFFLLAQHLRRLAFPHLPPGWVWAAAICYTLGGVGLLLVARSIGHHEAILVASVFVLSGCYFMVRGLEGGHWQYVHLVLAGLLFGLAFGSRHTMIGFPLAFGLMMVWRWIRAPRTRDMALQMVAFGVPPAIAVLLHLVYNYQRFGKPFDFGVNYALTGLASFDITSNALGVVATDNVWRNLYAYFVRLPDFIPYFPFHMSFSGDMDGWLTEAPLAPMQLLAPLVLFAPLSLLLLTPLGRRSSEPVRWFVVGASAGLIVPGAITIFQVAATARYLQDTLPVLTILGALGLWWLRSALGNWGIGRQTVRLVAAGAVVVSVCMGTTIGMSELSYDRTDAYLLLSYRFDRVVSDLMNRLAPESWRVAYVNGSRARRNGQLFFQSIPNALTVRGGPVARSLTVASGSDQPEFLVISANGTPVFQDRVYPGIQTIPLDEPVMADVSNRVPFELQLPQWPPQPNGSLLPVTVYNPNVETEFLIALSQRILIDQLVFAVEQGYRDANTARQQAEDARRELEQFQAISRSKEAPADTPEQLRRLEKNLSDSEAAFSAVVQKTRQDEGRLRVEREYVAAKRAKVETAAQR